jgi:hypothetical protein
VKKTVLPAEVARVEQRSLSFYHVAEKVMKVDREEMP